MKLVLAEKPELAKDIANALMHNPQKNKDGCYEDNQYVIANSYGHLLDLAEPEAYDERYKDRYNVELLPIYFKDWKKVAPQEDYKKRQLQIIGKLLMDDRFDCVIHAGDPDEEGQNLIDELLDYFHYKGTVYRVYINDAIAEHIQKEFKELKLNDDKMRAIGNSAYARQMTDKAFGINESRLANIRLHTNGSVGRVQTPTLGLVVKRDEAIENHQERFYYELDCRLDAQSWNTDYTNVLFKYKPDKETLSDDTHIYEIAIMNRIEKALKGFKTKDKVTEKIEIKNSPLPYNQTELSADMNTKYGFSLKKTLDITQALRDKYGIISYNRSDCQYLKEDHHAEAEEVLDIVFQNLNKHYPVDITLKSKCFNDSKVTAHHGIIPVQKEIDLSKLTDDERNVYEAICNRYIMQFLPPMKIKVSSCNIPVSHGTLSYVSRQVQEKGYTQHFPISNDEKEDTAHTFLSADEYEFILRSTEIIKKKTSPQKRYTPATLVKDMCAISKYVSDPEIKEILKLKDKDKAGEKGSIGTVATRGNIIEVLLKRGYLKMDGKSIVSTPIGREFYHLLPEEIKSPDVTAKWWLIQEDIKNGIKDRNALLETVITDFNKRKETAYQGKQLTTVSFNERESIGKCLFCGKPVYEANTKNGLYWYCSDYKNGCEFKLFEKTKRFNDTIKLTHNKVKKLLDHKSIKEKLTAKNGDKYETNLVLERNGKYVNLVIEKKK